jgi:predicted amidohydrolase
MRIHLVQMAAKSNDKSTNLGKILRYVEEGLSKGANLIIFGELALNGYDLSGVNYRELAEPIPGPSTEAVAKCISGKNCYVVFGMAESDRGFVYNAAPLIGPRGVVGAARKLYLADFKSPLTGKTYCESVHFRPGQQISVFDTEFGRIGIQICLDFYHSEVAQAQALAGAWLIAHPSATPLIAGGKFPSVWETRPWESSACWCYVNVLSDDLENKFNGGTGLYLAGKGLQTQASIGEQANEDVLEYEVESRTIFEARQAFSPLRDIRPEIVRQFLLAVEDSRHGIPVQQGQGVRIVREKDNG